MRESVGSACSERLLEEVVLKRVKTELKYVELCRERMRCSPKCVCVCSCLFLNMRLVGGGATEHAKKGGEEINIGPYPVESMHH